MSMGETAENVARKYQITRDQQERSPWRASKKAAAAQAAGKLKDEIVPIKGKAGTVEQDGCIRAGHHDGSAGRAEARLRRRAAR